MKTCHYSNQKNSEILIMKPLSLPLSKYKRNELSYCTQRNPKIASKLKLKSNYINSYSGPSPVSLAMAFGGNHQQLEQSDI